MSYRLHRSTTRFLQRHLASLATALAMTMLVPAIAAAQLATPLRTPVWLCKPGMPGNRCHQDLAGNRADLPQLPSATYPGMPLSWGYPFSGPTVPLDASRVAADGSTVIEPLLTQAAPALDCFYVYPTVDTLPNPLPQVLSVPPLATDTEFATLLSQVGRLASSCRIFAPQYRQVPITVLSIEYLLSGSLESWSGPGFADVERAFMHYWNQDNVDPETGKRRPFVLLGHSQGAFALEALMKAKLDGAAADNVERRRHLVSAVLLGGLVQVPFANPFGSNENSTFRELPLCSRPSPDTPFPTGCVIAYASYANEPRNEAGLAMNLAIGTQNACVNPAALLLGVNERTTTAFDTYMGTRKLFNGTAINPNGAAWLQLLLKGGKPSPDYPTGYARYTGPEWLQGRCAQSGTAVANQTWLQVDNADALYSRSQFSQASATLGLNLNFGLHLVDFNIQQGAIAELIQRQHEAWVAP